MRNFHSSALRTVAFAALAIAATTSAQSSPEIVDYSKIIAKLGGGTSAPSKVKPADPEFVETEEAPVPEVPTVSDVELAASQATAPMRSVADRLLSVGSSPAPMMTSAAGSRATHGMHGHPPNAVNSNIPCVAELAMVANRARVKFASGSAELTRDYREGVLVLAKMATACPEAKILIEGFADPVGNAEYNLALSWKRAYVVMDAIKAAGYSSENFEVYSHLTDHPDGICPHFEAVDRRTELIVNERKNG